MGSELALIGLQSSPQPDKTCLLPSPTENQWRIFFLQNCQQGEFSVHFLHISFLTFISVALGSFPNTHSWAKWCLILDLSLPDGSSANDGISPEFCSLSYITIDHATEIVSALEHNTQLAKIDIAHAYRTVLVHPDDRYLLGMQWDSSLHTDSVLTIRTTVCSKSVLRFSWNIRVDSATQLSVTYSMLLGWFSYCWKALHGWMQTEP